MAIRRVNVEDKVGAITAFVTVNNALYCLSAGHVLTGNNDHLDKNEQVFVLEDTTVEWIPAGISDFIQYTRGSNIPPMILEPWMRALFPYLQDLVVF